MDIIFYHGHCPDGWCAAYVASKRYPEAKLVPLDHGAEFDFSQVEGKDVLMLDFSLRTREENDKISSLAKSFFIFDHHKTAQAVLENAPYATFDMYRSGAGLAWDYLFGYECFDFDNFERHRLGMLPYIELSGPRPWWVSYTEARDLWRWDSLPNSLAVCAFIGTLPFDIPSWQYLEGKTVEDAGILGWGALAHIDHYVREAVKQAQFGVLQGYKTAVLNVPYLNCSEVGNELAKESEVSLTYFERGDSMIQFSLRSIGDIDVSAIAKVFGGGGHMHAAGFQKDVLGGRELIDQILGRDLARIKYLTQKIQLIEAKINMKGQRPSGGCL